ncbi:MAG: hypothetical protein K0R13_3472 [Propionibacteriaceae bacterium]|nr:hypothetical protein [Propionibacteriaceae bacterium]
MVRRLGSSQMTASNRMVCLIAFTSNVASTYGWLVQYCPPGAGIGDEIPRGVTGLDGDRVGIGQLLGDGLPFHVGETSRSRVIGSAPSLQIGQVVRRWRVWMELRDAPGRRGKHLGGPPLVSPAVPQSQSAIRVRAGPRDSCGGDTRRLRIMISSAADWTN